MAHAHILLDRSGSMESCREDMLSGVNEFLNTLKEKKFTISLTIFDSKSIDKIWDKKKIKPGLRLTEEEFVPRGMTPLNDAIALVIHEEDPKEKGTLVIVTDGMENASREHTAETVKKLINKFEKHWQVIYLGANQDAILEGQKRGLDVGSTMTYDTRNTRTVMGQTAARAMSYAETGDKGEFTDKQREEAEK